MITGDRIRAVRERLGETQGKFAKRLGVNQATISRWERKDVRDRLYAIAVEPILRELEEPIQ